MANTEKVSVGREYWNEIKKEFADQNGVYCLITDFVSWAVITYILWKFQAVSPWVTTKYTLLANAVAATFGAPWLMWKAHGNIADRDRFKISENEKIDAKVRWSWGSSWDVEGRTEGTITIENDGEAIKGASLRVSSLAGAGIVDRDLPLEGGIIPPADVYPGSKFQAVLCSHEKGHGKFRIGGYQLGRKLKDDEIKPGEYECRIQLFGKNIHMTERKAKLKLAYKENGEAEIDLERS